MKNAYEIRGAVTAIIIDSPKYGRQESIIDTKDLKKAMKFPNSWCLRWEKISKSFYCIGNSPAINGKRSLTILHRLITDTPTDMVVDHINHDTLDNRQENLRIVTVAENQQNREKITKKNSSGVRNVSWHKATRKWRVAVAVNKKTIHIGLFEDIKEAESVAIEARKTYMPFSQEALSYEGEETEHEINDYPCY